MRGLDLLPGPVSHPLGRTAMQSGLVHRERSQACADEFPLPMLLLHGERVRVRGGSNFHAKLVAAPHPDPLPTEEWGEGDGQNSRRTLAVCSPSAGSGPKAGSGSPIHLAGGAGRAMGPLGESMVSRRR